MADMKITVGLGRETGVHASLVLALLQVLGNDITNKMSWRGFGIAGRRTAASRFGLHWFSSEYTES
jgi:hypothetical protein